MGYAIAKAHRKNKCKFCTEPITRGSVKVTNHNNNEGARGRPGSLNFQNAVSWHFTCLTHNLALNMFGENMKLKNCRFYIDKDEAKPLVKKITELAYGFDASELCE